MNQMNDNTNTTNGPAVELEGEEAEKRDNRVEYHLSEALERSENDETMYHLREALSLLRL